MKIKDCEEGVLKKNDVFNADCFADIFISKSTMKALCIIMRIS